MLASFHLQTAALAASERRIEASRAEMAAASAVQSTELAAAREVAKTAATEASNVVAELTAEVPVDDACKYNY